MPVLSSPGYTDHAAGAMCKRMFWKLNALLGVRPKLGQPVTGDPKYYCAVAVTCEFLGFSTEINTPFWSLCSHLWMGVHSPTVTSKSLGWGLHAGDAGPSWRPSYHCLPGQLRADQ